MNGKNNGFGNGTGQPPFNPQEFQKAMERFFDAIFVGKKGILTVFLGLFIILSAFSSFYTVEPDEEAVVLRLGRYQETTQPGLHFKFPFGIDQAIKVKTRLIHQEEFGFRTDSTKGRRTTYSQRSFDKESLMLTGDLNVADVEWIVQFQITEPEKYLFNVRDPISNISDISQAVMRRVVGDRAVGEVLTVGRVEIQTEALRLTREVLSAYDMGVKVVDVKLQDVNPPDPVKDSFNEVNSAKQEQEKAINFAEKDYNRVIPEARGKAEKTIAEAEGYRTALINRSQGDATKFSLMLRGYKTAPKVTRERLYLETMEKMVSRIKEITVVDPKIKGLLPIFSGGNLSSKETAGRGLGTSTNPN